MTEKSGARRVEILGRLCRGWELGDWLWAYLIVSVGVAIGVCVVLLVDY